MIEFQYFDGCPNYKAALTNLELFLLNANLSLEELKITHITSEIMARELNFQGSPSIIINGIDLYTEKKPDNIIFGCRLYKIDGVNTGVLTQEFIREKYYKIKGVKFKINIVDNPAGFSMHGKTMHAIKKIDVIKKCPLCNISGVSVKMETVLSLLLEKSTNNTIIDQFALCMTPSCSISYYGLNSDIYYSANEINVPLWFKTNSPIIYACYCSKVTKDNALKAIRNYGAKNVKEVNQITGAMKNPDCLHNNPLGKCCHKIIQDIIDEELKDI